MMICSNVVNTITSIRGESELNMLDENIHSARNDIEFMRQLRQHVGQNRISNKKYNDYTTDDDDDEFDAGSTLSIYKTEFDDEEKELEFKSETNKLFECNNYKKLQEYNFVVVEKNYCSNGFNVVSKKRDDDDVDEIKVDISDCFRHRAISIDDDDDELEMCSDGISSSSSIENMKMELNMERIYSALENNSENEVHPVLENRVNMDVSHVHTTGNINSSERKFEGESNISIKRHMKDMEERLAFGE